MSKSPPTVCSKGAQFRPWPPDSESIQERDQGRQGELRQVLPVLKPSTDNGGSHTHKRPYSEKHLWDCRCILTPVSCAHMRTTQRQILGPRPSSLEVLAYNLVSNGNTFPRSRIQRQDLSSRCQNTSVKTKSPETLTLYTRKENGTHHSTEPACLASLSPHTWNMQDLGLCIMVQLLARLSRVHGEGRLFPGHLSSDLGPRTPSQWKKGP